MTLKTQLTRLAGRPNPLGVHWDGEGANVSVVPESETAA